MPGVTAKLIGSVCEALPPLGTTCLPAAGSAIPLQQLSCFPAGTQRPHLGAAPKPRYWVKRFSQGCFLSLRGARKVRRVAFSTILEKRFTPQPSVRYPTLRVLRVCWEHTRGLPHLPLGALAPGIQPEQMLQQTLSGILS